MSLKPACSVCPRGISLDAEGVGIARRLSGCWVWIDVPYDRLAYNPGDGERYEGNCLLTVKVDRLEMTFQPAP